MYCRTALQVIRFSPFVEMLKKINWGCEYVDFMLKKKFLFHLFFSPNLQYGI